MLAKVQASVQHHFHNPNYLYFMISLFLMILAPPIAEMFGLGGRLFMNITFLLIVVMAVVFTSSSWTDFWIMLVLGVVMYATFLFGNDAWHYVNTFTSLVFFTMAFVELTTYMLRSGEITANDIFASISGFIIMGIMVTPIFVLLHENFNPAFNISEDAVFYDFFYFSMITLTTVGFGDITPVHPMARAVTLLLAIIGQLYMTILVAIIIGKYLAPSNNRLV